VREVDSGLRATHAKSIGRRGLMFFSDHIIFYFLSSSSPQFHSHGRSLISDRANDPTGRKNSLPHVRCSLPHSVTQCRSIQYRNAQVLVASFCYTVHPSFSFFLYLFYFLYINLSILHDYMLSISSCRPII